MIGPNDNEFRYFDALDYVVFGLLLGLSAAIGVYFAYCAKTKQNTTSEYLLGSKKMGIFPISMSLIASYISGISLMGIPSEMYVYGSQYAILLIPELIVAVVMATVYIPVFYKLQITSSYEYLNVRFNPTVRTVGSILFICKMMLYIPIVIYVPALAFAQVSGFNLDVIIPTICIVCIFYTCVGGIKAVVWTDTVQLMLMFLALFCVTTMGTIDVGGIGKVWERNKESERLEFFNMDPDPTLRHTFWTITIGKFFQHLASCTINQAMVQRCLAMPSLEKARWTITIYAIGILSLVAGCCYTGLVVYAAFYDCDPITTKAITKADQILPYFVMKVTSHVPALPGIFVSGVFSASLSTMSTGLNSMSGVILTDFIQPLHKQPISELRASFYMKALVVFLGTICSVLSFIVDKLGALIQTGGSLSGITAGTLLGIFSLGMLVPWANSAGAIAGGFSAALMVGWICAGTQIANNKQQIVHPTKSFSVEGCSNDTLSIIRNMTAASFPVSTGEPFPLYKISYVYYTVLGVVIVLVVGVIVSYFTGFNDPADMDINLFSPVIHKFLPKSKTRQCNGNALKSKKESPER